MAEQIARDVFPEFTVALLHGRMKGDEKERVMRALRRGAAADPGVDDGRRSRRRRAERDADGRRARRALRPVAAAPAARPRRPRRARLDVRAAVSGAVVGRGARAAEGDGRHERRLRDRRARSAACAGRAISSARGSRACRSCAPAISRATSICSSWPSRRPATRVDAGTLTAAQQDYVQSVWQRQFGLITVG